MDQATADFLTHLADRNRSPRTLERYGEVLRKFAAFARSELHREALGVEEIDKATVAAFVRETGLRGERLAPATRNNRLAALRSFFRFLVAEERLGRDPSGSVAFAHLPERSPTFLTAAEFARLQAAVEAHGTEHYLRRDLAILVMFWHTGLRLRELVSLDLDQVNVEAERLRSVHRKGGDRVDVHFNVEVTIALRRWLWQRRLYPHHEEERALFLSDRGTRLSARAIEELVGKYAAQAKLGKRVSPHTLRHSTATELVRRGNGIEVVAEVLNHGSLNTTRMYVHLVGEQVHAAVASLAEPIRASGRK